MTVAVSLPTILRTYTGGEAQVVVEAETVREVLEELTERFPGLGERLLHDDGTMHRFVNVYVGDEDARFLQGLDTPVHGEVAIVPAVSGG